jgi:hypothetical protein
MSNEELMNLDLEGYARALNVDLLSGEELFTEKQAIKEISNERLLAVHNLSVSNLLNVDKQGGLAVPSIAVIDSQNPFSSFGEITLVADKSLIDPKTSRSNKAFASDSYSIRYPSVTHTPNIKSVRKWNEKIKSELPYLDDRDNDFLRNFDDRGRNDLENSRTLQLLFLKSQGKENDFVFQESKIDEKYVNRFELLLNQSRDISDFIREGGKFYNQFKEILQDEQQEKYKEDIESGKISVDFLNKYSLPNDNAFYEFRQEVVRNKSKTIDKYKTFEKIYLDTNSKEYKEFIDNVFEDLEVNERIFKGYTNSGTRQYLPHTLENVVRLMKGGARKGEGFFYGVGSVRAGIVKQFKSLKDIQNSRDKIISREEFEKLKEEVDNDFLEIGESLKPFYKYKTDGFGYYDNVGESLIEFYNRGYSKDFEKLDEDTTIKVKDFLNKLYNLPTEYFEVKIERAVDLSEFKGALVPQNTPQEIKDILTNKGLKVVEYNKNREERLQYFSDLQFQNAAGITKSEAVKRNNGNPLNLAPNGEPSILYQSYLDLGYSVEEAETLTAQVYSDSFFNFFGDWINDAQNSSKVVDKNGQPLIVYRAEYEGKYTPNTYNEIGIHLVDNVKVAEDYNKSNKLLFERSNRITSEEAQNLLPKTEEGLNNFLKDPKSLADFIEKTKTKASPSLIFKNFVNIKNLLIINEKTIRDYGEFVNSLYNLKSNEKESILNLLQDWYANKSGNIWKLIVENNTLDSVLDVYKNGDFIDTGTPLSQANIRNFGYKEIENLYPLFEMFLKEKNADGIIRIHDTYSNDEPFSKADKEIVAFSPNQIKSATENIGTFDSGSNDIRFQKQELSDEDFIRLIEDNGIVEFDEMCGI